MHVRITSDANSESGVGQVVHEISGQTRQNFVAKSYGSGLLGIGVVLMCRDSGLNFKRRVRFNRKEKTLYLDVMLELEQMRQLGHEERIREIAGRLMGEIPVVVRKYEIEEFDDDLFERDLKSWLMQFGSAGAGELAN